MRVSKYDVAVVPHHRSNEASWDRALRAVGGSALLWIGAAALAGTGLGLVLATVGAILLVTGLMGWCPLYAAIGISTSTVRVMSTTEET